MDYGMRWKPMQYAINRQFKDFVVQAHNDNGTASVSGSSTEHASPGVCCHTFLDIWVARRLPGPHTFTTVLLQRVAVAYHLAPYTGPTLLQVPVGAQPDANVALTCYGALSITAGVRGQ
jgi:hypothetical protein